MNARVICCFVFAAMASRRTSIVCTGFSRFCVVFAASAARPISDAPAEPRPQYLSRAIDLRRAPCQGLQVKRAYGAASDDTDITE